MSEKKVKLRTGKEEKGGEIGAAWQIRAKRSRSEIGSVGEPALCREDVSSDVVTDWANKLDARRLVLPVIGVEKQDYLKRRSLTSENNKVSDGRGCWAAELGLSRARACAGSIGEQILLSVALDKRSGRGGPKGTGDGLLVRGKIEGV